MNMRRKKKNGKTMMIKKRKNGKAMKKKKNGKTMKKKKIQIDYYYVFCCTRACIII